MISLTWFWVFHFNSNTDRSDDKTSDTHVPKSSELNICEGTNLTKILCQTQTPMISAGQPSTVKQDDTPLPTNVSSQYESSNKAPMKASLPRTNIPSTSMLHHLETSSKVAARTSQYTENGKNQGGLNMFSDGRLSLGKNNTTCNTSTHWPLGKLKDILLDK